MSSNKTLTLHSTKEGNGDHWFTRSEYGKKEIDSIIDPEGGNTKEPPTSIPSPFARFDLVRTAFAKLSQNANLEGESNDKRLVSECFDVGQIFFNYDKLKDKVKIIKWDKEQGLENLQNSPFKGHQHLGKALELFTNQDGGNAKVSEDDRRSGGYNFDSMDAIYILRFTDNNDSAIIGGTSPSTIFFSSPISSDDLKFVDIQFGNDKLFDSDYCPLYKREAEYQKFWHGLSNQTNFMMHFPEVAAYLKRSLDLLKSENNKVWQEIGTDAEKITQEIYNNTFQDLMTQSGDLVEALNGFRIKKVIIDPAEFSKSDFIIPSEKYSRLYPDRLKPMVLQGYYQGKLLYTKDYWNKKQDVPSYVAEDWKENKRKLPGQQDFYPWLTVSDFFEPYIIRLVYPINEKCFYNGEASSGSDRMKSYLLPLKKDFFDFFDIEDLTIRQGRKVSIKMENILREDAVRVTLTIPTPPKYGLLPIPIIFERIYSINTIVPEPDETSRYGGRIVELQFGVNLMPFIRIENAGFNPIYRVQLVDRDIDYLNFTNNYQLKFVDNDNQIINTSPTKERSKKKQNLNSATTKYYNIEKNFDYITVEVAGKKGIIIPRFDKVTAQMGNKKLTFAVDFGTTNTHIEYKNEEQNLFPFEISEGDNTIATLHDPAFLLKDRSFNGTSSSLITDIIPVEMIPENINKQKKSFFPTRTALLENIPVGTKSPYSFLEYNPALLYEKQNLDYNVITNLKWLDESDEKGKIRIEAYIESLLLMIRNKILLSGGNLTSTEVVWFYPLSMSGTRLENFEKRWCKSFREVISTKTFPKSIPESTAPFYWYSQGSGSTNRVKTGTYPAASIDIGGGTTDIVIFKDDSPKLITSFRFAANAIFGDAFSEYGVADRNGFVQKYKTLIEQKLENNGLNDLLATCKTIEKKNKSEDIVAFFFSLKDNKDVQNKTEFDFNELLSEDKALKVVFFVFYGAIIYHLACIMKAKKFIMPRYIAFSGNGSKVLKILSNSNSNLSELAKLIFEKVYAETYHSDGLNIVVDQNTPKEATCKGGLMYSNELDFTTNPINSTDDERKKIKRLKTVLLGTNNEIFATEEDIYNNFDVANFTSVEKEVKSFIDLLFSLKSQEVNIEDDFGINPVNIEKYKKILTNDLNQNIKDGFKKKKLEAGEAKQIEESLFFYPLVEGINILAYEIAKK